jgi:glutathione peroxidase-family protein
MQSVHPLVGVSHVGLNVLELPCREFLHQLPHLKIALIYLCIFVYQKIYWQIKKVFMNKIISIFSKSQEISNLHENIFKIRKIFKISLGNN